VCPIQVVAILIILGMISCIMIFKSFEVGFLRTNCYLIGDELAGEGVLIDPGGDPELIIDAIRKLGVKVTQIINTHAHFDHTAANRALSQALGVGIFIHAKEVDALSRISGSALLWGFHIEDSPPPSGTIEEGENIKVGDILLRSIHTPGHSEGSLSFFIESHAKVIVGDTLFHGGIGRTDFPGGSYPQLIKSIKEKLFVLGDEIEVYPGHGPPTTLGWERNHNPFL
jgi:glyoxylase-like metal-dependent hydrolase (beta-lactamase superfamily II)